MNVTYGIELRPFRTTFKLMLLLLYIGSLNIRNKTSEFLEIFEREHIDGVSYIKTIAEEGRRQEEKKAS